MSITLDWFEVTSQAEREMDPGVRLEVGRGTGSLHMSSECYWAASRSAEHAPDLALWENIGRAWAEFAPGEPEPSRNLARCYAAQGQYERATQWKVRESLATDGDELEASHFLQLALTARLDRVGRVLSITAPALARWVERRLRPIYKDAWRCSGQSVERVLAGETPDVIELQRLIARNKTVFGTLADRLHMPLKRLVALRCHWAHQQRLSLSDTQTGFEDAITLLRLIGAPEADEIVALVEGFS